MSATPSPIHASTAARAARWATVSIACSVFFFVAVILSHLIRTDLRPTTHFLSEYALGTNGFVMTAAFAVLGIGNLALTLGLWPSITAARHARVGVVLLGIGGIALLLVAIFPAEIEPDMSALSLSGQVHDVAALIFFVATVVGSILIALGFRRELQWQSHAGSEMTLALLAAVALLAFLVIYPLQTGENPAVPVFADIVEISQRVLMLCIWLWLLVTALRLRTAYAEG